jgi:stage II sporulation protein Q
MRNWLKRVDKTKLQFFFFVFVLTFVLITLVVVATIDNQSETPVVDETPNDNIEEPVVIETEEQFVLPLNASLDYKVCRKYYDKNASKENQELGLIKYGTTYRTSDGTGYSLKDNTTFDVVAVLSGKVVEVKENPLLGTYCVLEHDNDIKTYYYCLSESSVKVGDMVEQGSKVGTSGTTELDSEAGNYVFLKITKNDKKVNPETVIGKKPSELE